MVNFDDDFKLPACEGETGLRMLLPAIRGRQMPVVDRDESTRLNPEIVIKTLHPQSPTIYQASAFLSDFARYRKNRPTASALVIFLTEQGLWALLTYRASRAVYTSRVPALLKKFALAAAVLAGKLVEVTTGISLPFRADIGPGLYIGHFGNIIINEGATIGRDCNLSQGVTIGISGRGLRRGVPRIGDRVYLGANAVVAGPIHIGNDALVAANSLVNRNVDPGTTVVGVPAVRLSGFGSAGYINN